MRKSTYRTIKHPLRAMDDTFHGTNYCKHWLSDIFDKKLQAGREVGTRQLKDTGSIESQL